MKRREKSLGGGTQDATNYGPRALSNTKTACPAVGCLLKIADFSLSQKIAPKRTVDHWKGRIIKAKNVTSLLLSV